MTNLIWYTARGLGAFGVGLALASTLNAGNVVGKIHREIPHSKIEQCVLDDKKIYVATPQEDDLMREIYNEQGEHVNSCLLNGLVDIDATCRAYRDCKTIFVPEDNIWNEEMVDKYGINNSKEK
jgi:hypothetical protein